MRLAAIYNVWDGSELLAGSIKCIHKHIDVLIIVYQDVSNFDEVFDPMPDIKKAIEDVKCQVILEKYIPTTFSGAPNETAKRNLGLTLARRESCTHFLHLDCDEYYEDFGYAKFLYWCQANEHGSVCSLYTYFKKPTLRFENKDGYFVPFIHPLHPNTIAGAPDYPHYVDPTRRINCNSSVILDVTMHHFSWVRKDIDRKIRNSSARKNLMKGHMRKDYMTTFVRHGYHVRDYAQKLVEVPDIFNITPNVSGPA